MKFAVIGGRDFDDYELLKSFLDSIKMPIDLIVSGGCLNSPDILGEKYADDNCIEKLIFKPEWDKYGRSVAFVRNKLIIDNADIVIAFWDGKSKGTKHSLDYAKKKNKHIKIINY